MRYNVSFTKASASGNDFIILDNKSGELDTKDLDYPELARDLCRRHLSVGADGILILEDSGKADFKMRVINPDGSEVTMCGNGIRCSALYAVQNKWGEGTLACETGSGVLHAEVNGDRIKIKMGDPKDIKLGINLGIKNSMIDVHSVNTGVPHVVHLVEDLENYPVKDTGRQIREHTLFAPEGTNADFAGELAKSSASVRTYERGVEDETLACGTGVVASAVILGLLGYADPPVSVRTKSGEELTVYYKKSGDRITDVYLEGAAEIVYEGRV